MTKPANIRLKLFKALDRRPHRFAWRRVATQTFSLAVLVAVPLTGLAQVDFWRGNHRLLFAPAPFKHALAGVIVGIVAMYVVTFLSNVAAGRLFCGWGCPVGQVSRIGERLNTPGLTPRQRWFWRSAGALVSGVFVLSVFMWWADPLVLVAGSLPALAVAWAVLAVGTLGAYLHGKYWQWDFCKKVCPIGMYYSVVSPARYFGVHFRNEQSSCIECDACDNVCPVDLLPRSLAAPVTEPRGLSLADAPGHNHCLECGDCIRACEFMIETRGKGPVPLKMGFFTGDQRIDAPQESSDNPTPESKGYGTLKPASGPAS